MSDTPMCECKHRQANHSGINARHCMVSGCECKAFSEAMTPKEGPSTLKEIVAGLVEIERFAHGAKYTPNTQAIQELAHQLLLGHTAETLERDEKRRAALEKVVASVRLFTTSLKKDGAKIMAKDIWDLVVVLEELDALTPTPKEDK